MKAKTKMQIEVKSLSDYRLPDVDTNVVVWAQNTCFDKLGYRNKTRIACLECGYSWSREAERKVCKCPSCQAKIKIKDTTNRVLREERYFAVIQSLDKYQVNRYFLIKGEFRVGYRPVFNITEVCQQWVLPNGKYVIYSMRHKISWSCDYWTGDFEIRSNSSPYYWKQNIYNVSPAFIYPEVNINQEFKKYGIRKMILGVSPLDLMISAVTNNRSESLLKMGQNSILEYYIKHRSHYLVDRYWKSICICQRHGYVIKDASLWIDYLTALEEQGKDIRNPHYICPSNLKIAHDKAMDKRAQAQKKKQEIINQQNELKYARDKQAFIGASFQEEGIMINVLNSIKEFQEEGDKMHHCVYNNKYYQREDCLILSAKVKGVSVATIELSLNTWSVVQCRGKFNQDPPNKVEIITLMEKAIPELQKRLVS